MALHSRHISLRATLMAVVLLAVIPALGLTLWHGFDHLAEAKAEAQSKALVFARTIASDQNRIAVETERILHTLALTTAVQDQDATQCAQLLQSLLKEFGEPYLNFIAVDLDGQAFAQAFGDKLNNYADRQWFQDAVRTRAFTTSEYLIGKTTGLPTMAMAYPVRDPEGKIRSVLAAGVGLAGLGKRLANSLLPAQSIVTIIDHEGVILAREPPRPEFIGTNKSDVPIVKTALAEREGAVEATGLDGAPRIYAFTRIFPDQENSPVVYVGIDRTAAYGPVWQDTGLMMFWLAGVGLLGLAAAWVLGGRLLVRPVQAIAQAAGDIGEGRLSARITDDYPVLEFTRLAESFNAMAGQLEARARLLEEKAAAIIQANRELEREVGVRQDAEAGLALHAKRLQRSNEELEQFAYVASHDLQEPLRIIHSYLQLIERRYESLIDEDGRRFIQATMDAAERMRALIHGLLDYSRVSTKAQPFASVNAEEVFSEAIEHLGEAVAENRATVRRDALPMVRGDRTQIAQLFQNLLSNAVKYHLPDSAPEVRVTAQRDGDMWRFTVQDNGIGISPEYHERIFALFQRLHTRAHYPGTGIGLTVCKKIVERHNGRIWLESEPGQGSAFHFTLPAVEETP